MFQGIENILPSRSSRIFLDGGISGLSTFLRRLSWTVGVMTALIAGVFAVTPDFWFRLFFGDQYIPYSYVIRWIGVIYVLRALCLPFGFGLRTLENTQPIFIANVVSTLFTLLSVYPLMRLFDLRGTLMGMLVIQVIVLSVLWFAYKKTEMNA